MESPAEEVSVPILRLRGLPYSATLEEVQQFFADYDLETVHLGLKNGQWTVRGWARGRPSAGLML